MFTFYCYCLPACCCTSSVVIVTRVMLGLMVVPDNPLCVVVSTQYCHVEVLVQSQVRVKLIWKLASQQHASPLSCDE